MKQSNNTVTEPTNIW